MNLFQRCRLSLLNTIHSASERTKALHLVFLPLSFLFWCWCKWREMSWLNYAVIERQSKRSTVLKHLVSFFFKWVQSRSSPSDETSRNVTYRPRRQVNATTSRLFTRAGISFLVVRCPKLFLTATNQGHCYLTQWKPLVYSVLCCHRPYQQLHASSIVVCCSCKPATAHLRWRFCRSSKYFIVMNT